MNSNQIINISFSLDELIEYVEANQDKFPKTKRGRTYIGFTLKKRQEPDVDGNDISVAFAQSKIERLNKEKIVYIGKGKTHTF